MRGWLSNLLSLLGAFRIVSSLYEWQLHPQELEAIRRLALGSAPERRTACRVFLAMECCGSRCSADSMLWSEESFPANLRQYWRGLLALMRLSLEHKDVLRELYKEMWAASWPNYVCQDQGLQVASFVR